MGRKYVLAREPGYYNIELSGKQNKQRQTIPSLEQDLSGPNGPHLAIRPDAVDLAGGQDRESLGVPLGRLYRS
jgi:hypothetical protein